MSRDTERFFKQLMDYIEQHQGELPDDSDKSALIQRFMEENGSSIPQGNAPFEPQTSDDYLELAETAQTEKKKLEYLHKALELDPENLDAAHMLAELKANSPENLLIQLSALVKKGNAQMEKGGFFQDATGDFWAVLETRPYMRLRYARFEMMIICGMMRLAIEEAKEMLRLCTGDNLGVRYELMHLYAYMEDEKSALALYKQYDGDDESQMLLPLAILYYKAANFEQSAFYLRRLSEANKDIKKFLSAAAKGDLEKYREEMGPYGYRPDTIEELIYEYDANAYLFAGAGPFFDWAGKKLRNTNGRKKRSK